MSSYILKLCRFGRLLHGARARGLSKIKKPITKTATSGDVPLLITRLLPPDVTRTLTSVPTLAILHHGKVNSSAELVPNSVTMPNCMHRPGLRRQRG
jgi:hypothetical protein